MNSDELRKYGRIKNFGIQIISYILNPLFLYSDFFSSFFGKVGNVVDEKTEIYDGLHILVFLGETETAKTTVRKETQTTKLAFGSSFLIY